MTSIPTITESHILEKVTEKSFERGMDYYHSGMVESVVQRGDRLFADVLGSEWDPYQVGIALGMETSERPAPVHMTGAATASTSWP